MKKILIIIILLGFVCANNSKYTSYIKFCSSFYNIPYEIVVAMIHTESTFKKNAVSSKQAYGLMQVRECAYKDWYRLNPFYRKYYPTFESVKTNWKANVNIGCWYLKRICYKVKGTWKGALTAYNHGPWKKKTNDKYYKTICFYLPDNYVFKKIN